MSSSTALALPTSSSLCTRITMHCLSGRPGSLSNFPARFLGNCSSGVQRIVKYSNDVSFQCETRPNWAAGTPGGLSWPQKPKLSGKPSFWHFPTKRTMTPHVGNPIAGQTITASLLYHLWRLLNGDVTCHRSVDQDWNAVGHSRSVFLRECM